MMVNATLAIGLAPVIGFLAAASAATAAAWVNLALLWRGALGFGAAARPDAALARRLPRLGLASLAMAGVLLVAGSLLAPAIAAPVWRYGALFLLVASGMAAYAAACLATGAFRPAEIRGAFGRRR
jgi:putative peptidoglycan lipid II flippase